MKNWYDVTITAQVDRYGVDKTMRMAVESRCEWTEETIRPAITDAAAAEMAKAGEEGLSNVRVTGFTRLEGSPDRREFMHDGKYVRSLDIDRALNI